AALAYKNGYSIDLKELFEGLNFFKHSSSIGYIYSGSITKYLINNYGIDKFKKFYNNSDFKKVYGKDADTIIKDYTNYINSLNIDSLKHTANYYFGRKSIFAKECPRYVAEQQDLGWSLYDFKEYEESKEVFAGLISISNDYSSLLGYVNSLTELEKKDEAINVLEGKIKNFEGTSYYYNLELRLADLYALTKKISKADSLYNIIIEQNASKNVVDVAKIRLILLHEEKVFTEYVSGNDITKYLILRDLNKKEYNYISFKYLINLSKTLNEDYDYFLNSFDRVFEVTDYNSSYALMLLSEYMVEHFDLIRARKAAALSLRYHDDAELNILLKENYRKINWLLNNKQIAENLK
ncbi:MAG: tetratricopeptide repeat protein, partial [Syntrophothermus sp.]